MRRHFGRPARAIGIFIALLIASLLAIPWIHQISPKAVVQGATERSNATDRVTPLEQSVSPDIKLKAREVTVGIHLENAYNLSLAEETFNAEGWYWLTWPQAVQDLMDAVKAEPKDIVELVNSTMGADLMIEADLAEPELRPDGLRYQLFRFSGSFYSDDINLRKYPFNLLSLPIIIEVRPPSFSLDSPTPVILQTQKDANGLLGQFTDIGAFKDVGVSWTETLHAYATNFGTKNRSEFSQAVLRIFFTKHQLAHHSRNGFFRY